MKAGSDEPPDIAYEQRAPLTSGFSEADLVEKPAIDLFAALGWQTANLWNEFSSGTSPEGRASKREAILPNRLRAALRSLNPHVPETALDDAFAELTRSRAAIDRVRANAELIALMRDGVKVALRDASGAQRHETIRIIDWDRPEANDFLLASQAWFPGDLYTKRADLVGFVNGLPLLFIELKTSWKAMADAYNGNLADYRATIPHVFVPNAFVILSNGLESVLGGAHTPLDYFAEWKRVDEEDEPGVVSLDTLIKGTCRPARFLDIIENFIVFEEGKHGLVKKLVKIHQLLGVNRAIAAVDRIAENRGRLGVFWHTQGSGKSLSMLFFARKVLRKKPGDWSFVIVTDRTELDDQIAGTFSACGVLGKNRQDVQAGTREHLKDLLRGNERFVFTLIQKFGTARGEVFPVLSLRSDIIVITDEAHRSQYDTLATNMRAALPNAAFIGFTGTPLIAGEEERTREVFGDYVSIYDFAQSIADGATVPLYYESRLPELHITNEQLGDEIARVIDDADLTEDEEDALARRFAKQYQLITNDDRLEKVAADLVRHFSGRGYRGKAMFVAIDKATAIRMYHKVRRHWSEMLASEAQRIAGIEDTIERVALQEQLDWLKATDMAVVVSPSQNEIDFMAKRGLEIRVHRERMVKEDLDEKFKAAEDPLRLVFVCAMWITGFDVPTCSTVYLDKPMKNHTVMQTIARANRVAPGKQAGLIVDYVGVFRNLKDALAIYAQPRPGVTTDPIEGKAELVAALRAALRTATLFAEARGVRAVEVLAVTGFERQAKLQEAVEAILGTDDDKRNFLRLVGDAWKLFRAILPDSAALEMRGDMIVLQIVAETIRTMSRKDVQESSRGDRRDRAADRRGHFGRGDTASGTLGRRHEAAVRSLDDRFREADGVVRARPKEDRSGNLARAGRRSSTGLGRAQSDTRRLGRAIGRSDRPLQCRQHGYRAPFRGTDGLRPIDGRRREAARQGRLDRGRIGCLDSTGTEAQQGRRSERQKDREAAAREAEEGQVRPRLAAAGKCESGCPRDHPAGVRRIARGVRFRDRAGQATRGAPCAKIGRKNVVMISCESGM
jgi:type I restriction enzyme R subunit